MPTTDVLRLQDGTEVAVVRSARRRRSVSARQEDGRTVLLAPERIAPAELQRIAEQLHARLLARQSRPVAGDDELLARCGVLSRTYLDGRARPRSVRWVPTMRTRWASCTPSEGTIRVSRRLLSAPPWVLDYVLVHELAHLLQPGHDAAFWALCARYPRTERARGWLEGASAAGDPSAARAAAVEAADEHPGGASGACGSGCCWAGAPVEPAV